MPVACCINGPGCKDSNFEKLFDLGSLPLGNPSHNAHDKEIWSRVFELKKCSSCGFIQTTNKVPFDKLGDENFYVSDISRSITDNYKRMVAELPSSAKISKDALILEIGCGDGLLLRMFYDAGFKKVIGIEPNAYEGSRPPFPVINSFFNSELVGRLKKENSVPDLIILNSVIETISDLGIFFSDLVDLMKPSTSVFIEVPYFVSYLKEYRIDAFSHLTANWFTVRSLMSITASYGLEIIDFDIDESYRGGSVKVLVKKGSSQNVIAAVQKFLKEEQEIMNDRFFIGFNQRLITSRKLLLDQVNALQSENMPLYMYGGGLKACTLVNWLGLSQKQIIFAVDKDKNKHHKFIPKADIPIKPLEELSSEKIAVMVLALNHLDEVLDHLHKTLKKGSRIIIPLPELKTITI